MHWLERKERAPIAAAGKVADGAVELRSGVWGPGV
jgi:hypothetical protein